MKKIFISLLSLCFICLSVFAADYTFFPYDHNLILENNTYQKTENSYYGCFRYINQSKIKLNGKVFLIEKSCVKFEKGDVFISEKSTFNYKDNNSNPYSIKSNPYYFENKKIQSDIIDFFLAVENGGFSDRD